MRLQYSWRSRPDGTSRARGKHFPLAATLGALVANLIEADALIILTDQIGLFTADPRKDPSATLINEATAGDESLEAMAGGAGTRVGTGGMITKVIAAKRAARSGAHTVIASGRESDVMLRLARGESLGTLLVSETQALTARKQWLADHLQLAGRLILDAGAVNGKRTLQRGAGFEGGGWLAHAPHGAGDGANFSGGKWHNLRGSSAGRHRCRGGGPWGAWARARSGACGAG